MAAGAQPRRRSPAARGARRLRPWSCRSCSRSATGDRQPGAGELPGVRLIRDAAPGLFLRLDPRSPPGPDWPGGRVRRADLRWDARLADDVAGGGGDGRRCLRDPVRRCRQLGAGRCHDLAAAGVHPSRGFARAGLRDSGWVAGWGLAAAASVLAISLLWPSPARNPVRTAAIAACRALARRHRHAHSSAARGHKSGRRFTEPESGRLADRRGPSDAPRCWRCGVFERLPSTRDWVQGRWARTVTPRRAPSYPRFVGCRYPALGGSSANSSPYLAAIAASTAGSGGAAAGS